MKRKHNLIEQSDDEDEATIIDDSSNHDQPLPKSKKQKSFWKQNPCRKLAKITFLNLTVVAIAMIVYNNSSPVMLQLDKTLGERCSSSYWSPKNITLLRDKFDQNVFGQHIARRLVLSSLSRRWNHDRIEHNKPLVMSFHGWTGSGKNFVSKMVAESMFKLGLKSRYVKTFISTIHFYDEQRVDEYKVDLQNKIMSAIRDCPESLFIFDEIDKMPSGVLDGIKPYMDYHASNINGVDMTK